MKTIKITEHDEYFECERVFIIDEQDWNFSEKGDADAALRVAETIEAQAPESLEIICKYMTYADKLGDTNYRNIGVGQSGYWNASTGRRSALLDQSKEYQELRNMEFAGRLTSEIGRAHV